MLSPSTMLGSKEGTVSVPLCGRPSWGQGMLLGPSVGGVVAPTNETLSYTMERRAMVVWMLGAHVA